MAGKATQGLGAAIRKYIDVIVVNGFGDLVGYGTKDVGQGLRPMQTGRVQQYMLAALLTVIVVGAILTFFLAA